MGDPGGTGKVEGINQPEPASEQQEEGRDARIREDSTAGTQQTERPQPHKPATKRSEPSRGQ